jgi:predicted ferric reductase
MEKIKGYLLIIFLELITLVLWFLSKDGVNQITSNQLLSFSQVFALSGILLMSINLIISTRLRIIEALFEGLDEVYKVHQVVGALAFTFIINHPIFLVFQSLPNTQVAKLYLFPSTDLSYNLGIFALYSFLLAMIFIVFIKLPYHIWKFTHKFMGLTFVLASLHSMLIASDISQFLPLRYWILGWDILGIAAALYIIFLYGKYGPKHRYKVQKIEHLPFVTSVYLTPIDKPLLFIPGQFVYISVTSKGVGKEQHPFSISSKANSDTLRISAKIVGDYTLRLRNLNVGDEVLVYGPYGRFGKSLFRSKIKRHIMVAGGIGITPFLSMTSSLDKYQTDKKFKLFYSYKNSDEAVFNQELTSESGKRTNLDVVFWDSSKLGRLTAETVLKDIDNFGDTAFQICGPQQMMDSLRSQLLRKDIKGSRIITEDFKFL